MIPFLPDQGLWEGTGGLRRGQPTVVCVTGSRLWKSLFWLCRGDTFQTKALASYREKVPQEPGFSGKKGRMLETGLHKPPQFKFLWPETPSVKSDYY